MASRSQIRPQQGKRDGTQTGEYRLMMGSLKSHNCLWSATGVVGRMWKQ